jgi:hypothetical protein
MQAADQGEEGEQGIPDDGTAFAKEAERPVHRVGVADVGQCQQEQEECGCDGHLGLAVPGATSFHTPATARQPGSLAASVQQPSRYRALPEGGTAPQRRERSE